jgi:hypothetical protein
MDEFHTLVDVPLNSAMDIKSKPNPKKYIQCDHNREGGGTITNGDANDNANVNANTGTTATETTTENISSYRSPWTNEYYPPIEVKDGDDNDEEDGDTGYRPSPSIRTLEVQANEVFESYTKLYYGTSIDNGNGKDDGNGNEVVSSVYFWDKDHGTSTTGTVPGGSGSGNNVFKKGFGGCFLIKKQMDDPETQQKGFWNSIHHVDFGPIINGKSRYTLSTTILLSIDISMDVGKKGEGAESGASASTGKQSVNVSGSLSKEVEKTHPIKNPTDHIMNIGKMIEDVEIQLRSNMDVLYIQKTKEVIDSIRPSNSFDEYATPGRRSGTSSRSRGGSGFGFGGRGGGIGGLMAGGMPGLPPGAQNEMNAALMARFKKSNPS